MSEFTYTGKASRGSKGPDARRTRARNAGQSFAYVYADGALVQQALRNALGQFSTDQSSAEQVFHELGIELQRLMVKKLNETIVRPGVSTGRLARALMDPRNRTFTRPGQGRFAMAVGNEEFLDNSEAKYWRAVEQGTSHFVGRLIRGVWGDKISGEMPGGAYGPYPRAVEPFSRFGASTGGRLRPMGAKYAYAALRGAGYSATDARNGRAGIIQRPIMPHRYMDLAWREFDPRRRGEQIMRRMFGESFVQPARGSRRKPVPGR